MNKIIPKQNTSIQNNFWIIQVAAKGKCWSLCIQKKHIFLQYFFLMVVLMWEHVSFTNLKVNLLSYHDNRCYAILFVFLFISFCNFLRNYSYSMRYIIYHIKIVLNPMKLLYASFMVLFYVLRIRIHIRVMIFSFLWGSCIIWLPACSFLVMTIDVMKFFLCYYSFCFVIFWGTIVTQWDISYYHIKLFFIFIYLFTPMRFLYASFVVLFCVLRIDIHEACYVGLVWCLYYIIKGQLL